MLSGGKNLNGGSWASDRAGGGGPTLTTRLQSQGCRGSQVPVPPAGLRLHPPHLALKVSSKKRIILGRRVGWGGGRRPPSKTSS